MTTKQRFKAPEEASPEQYPVSPPPGYRADDHSWTLQTIMEIQKSIGALTQATTTLTDTVQAQGSKLDKISHRIYGLFAILAALGFLVANWQRILASFSQLFVQR